MKLPELVKMMEKEVVLERECLNDKKNNINSNYDLARIDFTCIDNMCDCLAVYEHILELLKDLQQRVIDRNTGKRG